MTAAASAKAFYVLGAGNVGLGLSVALREAGWRLAGIWNRGAAGRERAQALLGVTADVRLGSPSLTGASCALVCVSDRAIPALGAALRDTGVLRPGTLVAHTSGFLPAAALGELGGALRGSLHPIIACADPEQAARQLHGASFSVEGDAAALPQLQALVAALQGRALTLSAAAKPRYHAALVMASNLVVALLEQARREAAAAGCADPASMAALARGAIELAGERGPTDALTGPVLRGDAATVAGHLAALSPEARPIYKALSKIAVAMAEARGLDAGARDMLLQLLA